MPLIIAGERSGVGKTTVTLALLSYLCHHRLTVQSFKVGPDYIDPMFHQYVTGRACRNLDPILTSETYVQQCFNQYAQTADVALVEGVMGLFDGATAETGRRKREVSRQQLAVAESPFAGGFGSTAHVARLLKIPILLVVDCSRMSQSIAALVHGYRSFDPDLEIAGLVLNRVGSDRHLELLQSALEPLNIPILGVLNRQDSILLHDRHLGLIPTVELQNLDTIIDQLAHFAQNWFAWEQLMPLVRKQKTEGKKQKFGDAADGEDEPERQEPEVTRQEDFRLKIDHFRLQQSISPQSPISPPLRIAIAQDAAFSFYYQDNLDLLVELGAELVCWSPLHDLQLPENVHGLYFGGGFPEMVAEQLTANSPTLEAVRLAIQQGIPTYAECGGLMYLCQKIVDFQEQAWEMVGVLPTTAVMGNQLTLGYRQVEAIQDGVMLRKGAIAWGHEFHRSYLTTEPTSPLFRLKSNTFKLKEAPTLAIEGWHLHNLHASYIHLHWGANPELPLRFLAQCRKVAQSS